MAPPALLRVLPDAPAALCEILDPQRGAPEPPIRSEIFGPLRFAQHGRSLGETHRASAGNSDSAAFFPRLRNNILVLREAHRYIGLQAATGYDISPAAEWLLDNFHLIEAQLEEVRAGLPRRYFRALPVLLDKPLAGLPRVYGVAWAFVAHTDGAFDADLLAQFLAAYQETRELTLGELWALPTTLRVVLIENLRRLAERVACHKAAREVANRVADRIGEMPVDTLDALLAMLDERGVSQVFLAQMAQRLRDSGLGNAQRQSTAAADPQRRWLREALPDFAAVQAQQSAGQAADNLSVSNAVSALRAIGDADWSDLICRTSVLMGLMLSCPVFEAEHPQTRDQTLHEIERLARHSRQSEVAVAQALLALVRRGDAAEPEAGVASHWLTGPGRPALVAALRHHEPLAVLWRAITRSVALPAYLGGLALGTGVLVTWLLNHAGVGAPGDGGAWALLGAALMLGPASEAVVAVINRLVSESARPAHLPRLALAQGIPPAHRVLVVVPAMLTDPHNVQALVHRLLLHHLANPEPAAQFALLSDWADADSARTPRDEPLLQAAVAQIDALNASYPVAPDANSPGSPGSSHAPRFILLHREREFSTTEQRWIGWERKRGKLERLVDALATGSGAAFLPLGEASRLAADTRYLVTLDSDTQLPPGRLRELVGVAAHPHNQPRLDASGRGVASGYGILQPRVVTPLPALAEYTYYHGLFAGQCGTDPYSAATSEVYQDLFGEGSFSGKGLLHVAAAQAVLAHRLPEGQVLSHDLLEGSLLRCAAATDITVIEDAPFHADVAAARLHRWTRGDWQLLPILLQPRRYPLRLINRWKMWDNLRRSLVAPMAVALLGLALAGLAISPLAALALVVAALSAGPLMGAMAGLSPSRDDLAKLHFYRQAGADLVRALAGGAWLLQQLLAQAMRNVDAIVRSLWRMTVSHRLLLQWTPFAAAQAGATHTLAAALRRHWAQPLAAAALLGALLWAGTPWPGWSLALCALWASAPLGSWWVSRPKPARRDAALSTDDQAWLLGLARDTWRMFERCVGPEDRHLPPDNLQTLPLDMVAHRTSPTNIGMYLLSAACARQFGWIGSHELLDRLDATLATLAGLQRHRGHFLNWYDTQRGEPLLPMYVSTVDSGNLCGHLLAVAQACREWAPRPLDAGPAQRALAASRQRLAPLLARRQSLTGEHRASLRACLADHGRGRRSAQRDADAAFADHGQVLGPSPGQGPGDSPGLGPRAAALAQRLLAIAARCEQLADDADFSFLYHRQRHLFHIGWRVAEQQLDAGFYDLLASESRLTSLFAIAKGDVPVRHWAALGRPFYAVGSLAGLRSWSGSMFEYLMPTLVLAEPPGSVLAEACHAALREQINFTRAQKLPWGVSESAYAGRDQTLAYQYAPQGVPRLALRRTPPDELVIAPYATALALQIAPHRARRNFDALAALGARGRYGFIEALDFTVARQAGTDVVTPVGTLMAHHQGMSIVALANLLLGGVAQRWGMGNPLIEAVASLLHEKPPREVSLLYEPVLLLHLPVQRRRTPGFLREVLPGATALEPTHLLSNGRYGVALRANGAGWSRWGGGHAGGPARDITRTRDDALRDAHGSFFYLRWDQQPQPVSITQHPAPDPAAQYQSSFHADRVCFDALWPGVQAHTTVWVSPEDDIEFRQVVLHNLGGRTLDIELISAFDVTLTDPRADEAHPAFTSMFLRAEWLAAQQALLFERKPRLVTEPALQAAHFLAESDPQVVALTVQTDRARWLGRNRTAAQPLATLDALPPADSALLPSGGVALPTGLDPVCALGVRLRIAPYGKAQITFATAASDHPGTLRAVIDKYRQPSHVARASLMSATLAGIRLRKLRISADNFAAVQSLTTALVLSLTQPQYGSVPTSTEGCDRRLLWRFGISGDRPIVLVAAGATHGLGLLRTLAQALRLWSWGGIACDLVVINAEPASYLMALHRELSTLRDRHASEDGADADGTGRTPAAGSTSFHVLRAEDLSADELITLDALARLRLDADGRPLLHHVQAWIARHEQAFEERHHTSLTPVALMPAQAEAVPAPVGTFSPGSAEFRFAVDARQRPLRPWVNVLANPGFGAIVSEAGGGCTWAQNSRLNQLTAWSNDAVADTPAEWWLLQDARTREVWSVTPSAWGDADASYRVAHGAGHTRVQHRRGDVDVTTTWCVDADNAVKQIRVRIVNRGPRRLRLRLVGVAEWLMGTQRSDRSTVHTALFRQRLPDLHNGPGLANLPEAAQAGGAAAAGTAQKLNALLCTQRERSAGFGESTAFLAMAGADDETEDWTCDRRELFDARGALVLPDHFGQRSGGGLDPCAALSVRMVVPAGEAAERTFLLGHGANPEAARRLATLAACVNPAQRQADAAARWDELLGATTVATPDPLFDALVNRWLLYQAVGCRLWAKAAFYQAGGATGFRDQLQDTMALAWAAPHLLREQIVLCASRQFPEGDVQHWWHSPTGAGVRTHFSDDLLWLAYACVHHLRATGDATLLAETVPFIEGGSIPAGAEDLYETPVISVQTATVYEHAARAIDRSLKVGAHGLPLMGSGDWNDGMNLVGHGGKGESVWLAWFLCQLVTDFAPLARQRGELPRADRWLQAAAGWRAALQGAAWDGSWFKRAFFDNGQALGSHTNTEARIDLIAQAWSVLSDAAPQAMQQQAMAAVEAQLMDDEAGLIRLLDPPLALSEPSAGYIQAYPPGVRENGGQYSHGGVWALMAQARLGLATEHNAGDAVYRSFTWLSPAHRAAHPTRGPVYGAEPYAVAGDVYSAAPYVGRAGWSWYTGAAAWLHRAAVESIFGLQLGAQTLRFQPSLPSHWPRAELTLRRDGRTLRFVLLRGADGGNWAAQAPHGARLLAVGEALAWPGLPADSCFVIPLPG